METYQLNLPIDDNLEHNLLQEQNSDQTQFNMTLNKVNKVYPNNVYALADLNL